MCDSRGKFGPTYAVYAISSLDTELSLRYRTQNGIAIVGHNRELPGSLPGPSHWKKRPGRIVVMVMYIAPARSPTAVYT